MKIYFHQYIVEYLIRHLPKLFGRYFDDYRYAIVHRDKREKEENYKPDVKCCVAFIKKEIK